VRDADGPQDLDLAGVDVVPAALDELRRLALGHWLRRWWPASQRDGIAGLDPALLDVEIALLTVGAQAFFTDDTLDSDVAELLRPHGTALGGHAASGDPRIRELVRAGTGLADELGIDGPGWPELLAALDDSAALAQLPGTRQDDYALAAGTAAAARESIGGVIGEGIASVTWSAVPPRIFDAAEHTVDWTVRATGTEPRTVTAVVQAALIGPEDASGIGLRVRSGPARGDGVLEADGRATLPLVDAERRPLTESAAWNHDWTTTTIIVGADAVESQETPQARERVRRWARARLDARPDDAFLAEILAAESAY
jgi:hypothetical protein